MWPPRFRNLCLITLALILSWAAGAGRVAAADDCPLQVGMARVDITPDPEGDRAVWLAGYGQNRRATGIHDPLYATALVLSDGQTRFALVSLDLVGLQRPDVLRIRAQFDELDYVLVASTHNHEGPDVIGIWGPGPISSGVDSQYVDTVVEKTVGCIRAAIAKLQPARATYGKATVPTEWLRDSRLPLARDTTLRVVMFREPREEEKPVALLVQYSCHPESLGSRNTEITADFPSATIAALEQRYGCPIAYFTGAVGGLMTNPENFTDAAGQRYRDENFEYAAAYGKAIADVAAEAVESSQPVALTPFHAATVEVATPLSNPLYQAARAVGVLKREAVEYDGDWRRTAVLATPATPVEKLAVKTEVACLALGEVTVAAVPGEIYPELIYGQYQEPVEPNVDFPDAPLEPSLIELLDTTRPLFLGLANDEIGYIIPRRQWDQSPPFAYGRESSQYGEMNSCGPGIAPILMEAFQETAQRLRQARGQERAAEPPQQVFVVPNFHPASCGWLTDWSTERNYCANSYFDHLDRVRDDVNYNFALSECNNLIAMRNFRPERITELQDRIREGRVELCNAFFLEPTINLSGGEALVKMGVEGLRWQQLVMGVRPRLSWMIDVTGMHEQMAQIVDGLGLDALAYCRLNPTGSTLHWLQSPDESRTLAISPGHYLEWRPMFGAQEPLTDRQLQQLADDIRERIEPRSEAQDQQRPDAGDLKSQSRRTPTGAPVLILGGSGDYNLAPRYKSYPSEFLTQFQRIAPQFDVRFSTPDKYLDQVLPGIRSGAIRLPTLRGGTEFTYNAFWIQNPRVKSWYRHCEQQLQAAEMLATAASLQTEFDYPVQSLYHGWLQLLLNMDRNTLWGAAGGMVFEHERSWDARDRFESVERISRDTLVAAAQALAGDKRDLAVFNPLNWRRDDPLRLPAAVGTVCQALPGTDDVLCRIELPPMSLCGARPATPTQVQNGVLPPVIETRHYRVRLDVATGALISLRLRPSNREMLGGPANVIVAEQPKERIGSPADHMVERSARHRVADSSQSACQITVTTGPVATVVEAESSFVGGGRLRRQMVFYHEDARIDFETELNDLPDRTVIVAEFPLSDPVREVRRGIPYGFSHAAWSEPNPALDGVAKGITPAVRWSHYQAEHTGLALLDRGLSGREIVGNTPVLYLYNAVEKYRGYPNAWLSGAGRHVLHYAIVAHEGDFATARIPQRAWEFNNPPQVLQGGWPSSEASFVETSDNVIVEALRREGAEIEMRLAECWGVADQATVTLNLPHRDAALTNMVGGSRRPLRGGPSYEIPVRPQQIVTLRFRTDTAVPDVQPLTEWDELVPEKKREALRRYLPDVQGHPPAGGQ